MIRLAVALTGATLVVVVGTVSMPAARTQTARYIPGIFVSSPNGPIELIAFAELMSNGTLKMASGTLEDVPTIRPHATLRVLAAVPNWPPAGVVVASQEMFRDESAERRTLPFAVRKLNVYSVEMRIVDLETRESVARLLRSIRASERTPGYAFIIVASSGMRRFYPIRLSPDSD